MGLMGALALLPSPRWLVSLRRPVWIRRGLIRLMVRKRDRRLSMRHPTTDRNRGLPGLLIMLLWGMPLVHREYLRLAPGSDWVPDHP